MRGLGGVAEARRHAQRRPWRTAMGFRHGACAPGRDSEIQRRGSTEWLTGRLLVVLDDRAVDGDDEEARKFRNSSGSAELGVDVQGLLVLVLGVAEVEEVEVDGCAGSAELEGVHGVAAALSRPH